MSVNRVAEALKKERVWRDYTSIRDRAWDPEFDAFYDELAVMHKQRTTRTLTGGSNSRKISEAGLIDQSYRSRCVDVLIQITRRRALLGDAIDNFSRYVMSERHKLLEANGYKTKVSQGSVCSLLTKRGHQIITKMDTLTEMIGYVTEDIDKASYTLNRSMTAVELATKREWSR